MKDTESILFRDEKDGMDLGFLDQQSFRHQVRLRFSAKNTLKVFLVFFT